MSTTTVAPVTTSRPPFSATVPQYSPTRPPAVGTRVQWETHYGATTIAAVGVVYSVRAMHRDGIHVPAEYSDLTPVVYGGTIVWVAPRRLFDVTP